MRAIVITAFAAAAALSGCTMGNMGMGSNDAVVVADTTTPGGSMTTVTPATEPTVVAADAAAPLPILGTWRCGIVNFTITPGTYKTVGGSASRIESIDRISRDDYRLTLRDARKIRLSGVIDGKLTWLHENAESDTNNTASCTRSM